MIAAPEDPGCPAHEYKAYIYDSLGEPMYESAFLSLSDCHALYLVRCAMPLRARAELWSGSRRLGYLEGPLSPLEPAGPD